MTILHKIAAVASAFLCALAPSAEAQELAIVHAKLLPAPDAPPIEDGTIVVDNGRIVAVGKRESTPVPAGARIMDAAGLTAAAGFWNSHVHIITPELLRAETAPAETLDTAMREMFLRWGFTTVFDVASSLGNTNWLRKRIASGEVVGPDILTVGDPFYPKNGTPIYVRDLYENYDLPLAEVSSIAEATARVADQAQSGAEGVKIFAGAIVGGKIGVLPMDLELATAIVDAAHERGMPVFAHPSNLAGINVAIESGADVLAHAASMAGPWDKALVERMLSQHMAFIPTMDLFQVEGRRAKLPQQEIDRQLAIVRQQIRAFRGAGGQILFGTDIGYTQAYDTSEEIRLLGSAGLDWRAILAALTVAPAERFGATTKGKLVPGMAADIVLLGDDPTKEISAFSKVRAVIKDGETIWRAPTAE
jgi:imidazolonepropionase-like amidohydrolase